MPVVAGPFCRCITCGQTAYALPEGAACLTPGKHPRLNGWQNLRIIEPDAIRRILRPNDNLGIRTGDGLAVLDVDPRHGGDEALAELERTYRALPQRRLLTGGGGEHLYFSVGGNLPSVTLAPGLEFKCTGTQVVAPPSFAHVHGVPYAWEVSAHPADLPLASLPDWLHELVEAKQRETMNHEPGWAAQWLRTPIARWPSRPRWHPQNCRLFPRHGLDCEIAIAIVELWEPNQSTTRCG